MSLNMNIPSQPYITQLQPYQPGLPIEQVARQYGLDASQIIKLASNENPFGMSPKASAAVEAALSEGHRYPEQFSLLQALAVRHDVKPTQLVLGNGSNDVLDLIARVFLGPGVESVSSQYAFVVYQLSTQAVGATNIVVPAANYGHDLNAMLAAITPQTRVVWIANPNNPTGTFLPSTTVKQFLAKVPPEALVVLDEAYHEYLSPEECEDTVQWLQDFPNLIAVRTFSKIYGLAGVRVGYGIASAEVADLLNRVRQAFNVNTLGLAGALGALKDNAFVQSSFEANLSGRQILVSGLQKLGLTCLPAYGNFVTVEVPDAAAVNEALLKKGVIVRPLVPYGMPNHLRITIGTPQENERFLSTLTNILR